MRPDVAIRDDDCCAYFGWVVERTFGWLGRYRRLSKDFEHQPRSSEAMVYAASIHRMLRLLAAPAPT